MLITTPPKKLFTHVKRMNSKIYNSKFNTLDMLNIPCRTNNSGSDNNEKEVDSQVTTMSKLDIKITQYTITIFYGGKVFRGEDVELTPTRPIAIALKLAKRYESWEKDDYKMVLGTSTHDFSYLVKKTYCNAKNSNSKVLVTSVIPLSTRRKSLVNSSIIL